MKQLFAARQFADFGPNYLFPHSKSKLYEASGHRPSVLRRDVRELCCKKPGVYGMLNRYGELIYIGKAKNLRSRLLSYFRVRSRHPKAGRILANTRTIVWEINHDEFGALHRELELIRRWRPRYNVQGLPNSRRPIYLCLGRNPAPYIFLASRPAQNVMGSFGPIPSSRYAQEAVRRLNDCFGLRDCSQSQEMHFAEQQELFPVIYSPGCLRHEIGTCLGPCAAGCSRDEYFAQIKKARDFMEGADVSVLTAMEKEMDRAAAAQDFERAAKVRDNWQTLRWLHEKLDHTRQLRQKKSFIYPLQGWDGDTVWYVIHAGQTIAAVTAPRTKAAKGKALTAIDAALSGDWNERQEAMSARRDSILLVAAWFRRYPQERKRVLSAEHAVGG